VSLWSQVSEPRPLPRLGSPSPFLVTLCSSPNPLPWWLFHFYLDFRVVRISCVDLPFPLKKLPNSPQFNAYPFHPGETENFPKYSRISNMKCSLSKDSTVFCSGADEIRVTSNALLNFMWAETTLGFYVVTTWICGNVPYHSAGIYKRVGFVLTWHILYGTSRYSGYFWHSMNRVSWYICAIRTNMTYISFLICLKDLPCTCFEQINYSSSGVKFYCYKQHKVFTIFKID
jgi:hypothetical protein